MNGFMRQAAHTRARAHTYIRTYICMCMRFIMSWQSGRHQALRHSISLLSMRCSSSCHLAVLPSCRLAWHATSICLNIWHNSLFNFGRHVNRALTFATRSDRNFHSDAVAVALILLITFSVYTNLAFHWKRAAIFAGTVWKYITASDNCGNNAN